MTDATKKIVYPPGPLCSNSPIQSVAIGEDETLEEWTYMTVGMLNYVYGYTVRKKVNLYKAGEDCKCKEMPADAVRLE